MKDLKVGTRFKTTDEGLKQLCEDAFGPIDEQWDSEEMLHERENNLWKITSVYGGGKRFGAERVLPENIKHSIEDFLDDMPIEEFGKSLEVIV